MKVKNIKTTQSEKKASHTSNQFYKKMEILLLLNYFNQILAKLQPENFKQKIEKTMNDGNNFRWLELPNII